MRWQQLIVAMYCRMSEQLVQVLTGLTTEDLHKRPAEGANPIGWLAWHVTRSMDRLLGDIVSGEQLWTKEGWHTRFNRPPDQNDTGCGHTDAQVDSLTIPDVQTLLAYHNAVVKPLLQYLEGLSEEELDRQHSSALYPGATKAVYERLTLSDLEHVGQAAYVRGLLKGQGWLGR